MLRAQVGLTSYVPAATLDPVDGGDIDVTATSELMSSFTADNRSTSLPCRTIPKSVCMRNIAASSIRNAPAAPCWSTVWPDVATLTA